MKIKLLCGIIICILILGGCHTITPDPPFASCTFTIPEPADYECSLDKAKTDRKIKLLINLKTKWVKPDNGTSNLIPVDDKTIEFDPSLNSFPMTIDARITSDNKTAWQVEINMQGTECSTCADGLSDEDELPRGKCFATLVPNVSAIAYYAAKPAWQAGNATTRYTTTYTTTAAHRIGNVPNSCNCTTP